MKTISSLVVAFILGVVSCALAHTDTNITVTGTATINDLLSTGGVDFVGNTLSLGAWNTNNSQPGILFAYSDATSDGGTSSFTLSSSRNNHVWLWEHNSSTGLQPMMQLDALNRLTLFNPEDNTAAIVFDPSSTAITLGGQNVLTQNYADQRYVSVNENGDVGIGTSSPVDKFDISDGTTSFLKVGSEMNYGTYRGLQLYNAPGEDQRVPIQLLSDNGTQVGLSFTGRSSGTTVFDWFIGADVNVNGGNNYFCWDNLNGSIGCVMISNPGAGPFFVIGQKNSMPFATARLTVVNETSGNIQDWMDGSYNTVANVTPTGGAFFGDNVGVGTTTPRAQLHVAGNGQFDGPVRIQPQGDLDMGEFTTDPTGQTQTDIASYPSTNTNAAGMSSGAMRAGGATIQTGTALPVTSGSSH